MLPYEEQGLNKAFDAISNPDVVQANQVLDNPKTFEIPAAPDQGPQPMQQPANFRVPMLAPEQQSMDQQRFVQNSVAGPGAPLTLDPSIVEAVKRPVVELDPDILALVKGDQSHFDNQVLQRLNDQSAIGFGVSTFVNPLGNEKAKPMAAAIGTGARQGINELGNAISQQSRMLLEGEDAGKAYYNRKKQEGTLEVPGYTQSKEQYPIATTLGDIGAKAVATAPLGAAGGFTGALAGGAALGALQVDPEAKLSNTADNAVTGALTSGGLYGAGKVIGQIPNVIRGGKLLFTNTDDVINHAVENTLKKHGTSSAQATEEEFMNRLKANTNRVEIEKDRLYGIRNVLAKKEGSLVGRSNIQQFIDRLSNKDGINSAEKSALAEAKSLAGSGKPISFKQAQTDSDNLNKTVFDLYKANNTATGGVMKELKAAIDNDINDAVMTPNVKSAHEAAQLYNATVYSPLKNLKVQEEAKNIYGTESFVSSIIKRSKNDADVNLMLAHMSNEDKAVLIGAYSDVLRKSKLADNSIDLNKVASGFRELSKSKNLRMFGPISDDIETLSKVLGAKQMANKVPLTAHSLGQAGAVAAMQNTAGALSYFIVKPFQLAKVGQLINNKAAQNLLNAYRVGGSTMTPATESYISDRISKLWSNMTKAGASSAIGGEYVQTLQDQKNQRTSR